jgi:hypothetical protein
MKVLALIYSDSTAWEAASPEERGEVYAKYRAFGAQAGDRIVTGAELTSTRSATTVRVRDGETVVTDGPFAETKEQLGGFYLFDCAGLDEAERIAAEIPGAAWGAIELRPAHDEAAS